MKLLLDTHIWLWSLLEPARLSRRVARALARPQNELWISPVSTWEILVLCQKGRLALKPDARSWIASARTLAPCRDAPLTHEVAMAIPLVSLPHRDPADSFLAATAVAFDLTLVTADRNLLEGAGFEILANQ